MVYNLTIQCHPEDDGFLIRNQSPLTNGIELYCNGRGKGWLGYYYFIIIFLL